MTSLSVKMRVERGVMCVRRRDRAPRENSTQIRDSEREGLPRKMWHASFLRLLFIDFETSQCSRASLVSRDKLRGLCFGDTQLIFEL